MSILLFDNQSSPDLLSNGGFETAGAGDPDFWADWIEVAGDGTLANETTIVHEGTDAAKVTAGAGTTTYVRNNFTTVPRKRYRARFWTRGDGTYAGRHQIQDQTNSVSIIARITTGVTGTTYTLVELEFAAPPGCVDASIRLWCPSTDTGIAYFDACEVRSA